MSGAETARRSVFQRRIGGAEMALPLNTSPLRKGTSPDPTCSEAMSPVAPGFSFLWAIYLVHILIL